MFVCLCPCLFYDVFVWLVSLFGVCLFVYMWACLIACLLACLCVCVFQRVCLFSRLLV